MNCFRRHEEYDAETGEVVASKPIKLSCEKKCILISIFSIVIGIIMIIISCIVVADNEKIGQYSKTICYNTTNCNSDHAGIYWTCNCVAQIKETNNFAKLRYPAVDYHIYRITKSECDNWIESLTGEYTCRVNNPRDLFTDGYTIEPSVGGYFVMLAIGILVIIVAFTCCIMLW